MFKNLDDVMKRLTFLKNISDGHDKFDIELNTIAEMLQLFNIQWHFVEDKENDKFIARLITAV